jgi:hypothetical protein
MREVVRAIAAISRDGGLELDSGSASAESIRDENEYPGVRVTLIGTLSVARPTFHSDIKFGRSDLAGPASDRVTQDPRRDDRDQRLPTHHGSRRENRHADPARHRQHPLNGDELHESMITVANHRQAELVPLEDVLSGFASLAQPKWAAWRRRQRLEHQVLESFSDLLAAIGISADQAITDQARNMSWRPESLAWEDPD